MNWEEYKQLALRTESIPTIRITADASIDSVRMLHAIMGITTELAELVDGNGTVNFIEEVGDVLWYLAIADDVIGWDSKHTVAFSMDKQPLYWIGELHDVMKRAIFYGKPIDTHRLISACANVYADLVDEVFKEGLELQEVYKANIMKLEKRYPDKYFDANAATHRDVDRELDHIAEDGTVLEAPKPTLPDRLVVPNTKLDAKEWAHLVAAHLHSPQLAKMAMDLCFARAASLRAIGAIIEARAYDELYRMCGGSGSEILGDTSMYNIWTTLGYSIERYEVIQRLERWK